MTASTSVSESSLSEGDSPSPVMATWASKIRAIESFVRRSEDEEDQVLRGVMEQNTLKRNDKKDKRKQGLGKHSPS